MNLGTMIGKAVHTITIPDPDLPLPYAKVGIEVEFENWNGKNGLTHWANDKDDSLRNNGQEFRTNGPKVGKAIFEAIDEFCAAALGNKWDTGLPRASIHLHIDCTDLNYKRGDLARLLAFYLIFEHAFFGFAGGWRDATGYCVSYAKGQHDFAALGKVLYGGISDPIVFQSWIQSLSKYQAVNLKPLVQFGTIEVRHLPTTFEADRIKAWTKLFLQLKKAAMAQDSSTEDPIKAFSTLSPTGFAEKVFGEYYGLIRPFLEPHRMWEAVDNATALMSFGNAIKIEASWNAKSGENPITLKKLAMLQARESETSKRVKAKKDLAEKKRAIFNQAMQGLR